MLLQITEPGATETPTSKAFGIDLGTTNSVAALFDQDKMQILAQLPSVVTLNDQEIHSIKRHMGHDHIIQDKKPVELSALILKEIRNRAETASNEILDEAIITVPAHFDDAARQATKQAAQLAGIRVLRLLNEPTAAALAYGLQKQVEGLYAIYDFGGGTFDISILRLEKGIFRVIATGGDTQLGGDDIDKLIAEKLSISLKEARNIKEELTTQDKSFDVDLTRTDLDILVKPLIEKTIAIFKNTLNDAGIEASDLKGLVLVGGATRMPQIPETLTETFGITPLSDIDPDLVVAHGAAYQAHALTEGSDTLLLDICPLSLGIETMGGIIEKIIDRNSPIPISKSQEFTNHADGQTAMMIHVLQGEREMVEDCRSLAKFELTGIPPMIAGKARILINFDLDADNLLTVTATEQTTGTQQQVHVVPSSGLTEEEVSKMLMESLEHGDADLRLRMLREAIVEAESTLNALNSGLKEDRHLATGEVFESMQKAANQLEKAMQGDDREAIHKARELLEEAALPFVEARMHAAFQQGLAGTKVD